LIKGFIVFGKNKRIMEKIEFIIPSYNRPDKLMTILMSIKCQSLNQWKVHVVADAQYEGFDNVRNYFEGDDRFKFSVLNGPHGDWGHTARNYGLEHAEEKWVVMSGDDNYYMPLFVEIFLNSIKMRHDVNFVHCNLVHNWVNNEYISLVSVPKVNGIDIGNFMTRTKFAKQLRLDVTKGNADGIFVEEFNNKFKGNIVHLNQFLYVHN
jgi:glycosyltransferase involved in cell wall biosynthesis